MEPEEMTDDTSEMASVADPIRHDDRGVLADDAKARRRPPRKVGVESVAIMLARMSEAKSSNGRSKSALANAFPYLAVPHLGILHDGTRRAGRFRDRPGTRCR